MGSDENVVPNVREVGVPHGRIFELFKDLRLAFYDQASVFRQAV